MPSWCFLRMARGCLLVWFKHCRAKYDPIVCLPPFCKSIYVANVAQPCWSTLLRTSNCHCQLEQNRIETGIQRKNTHHWCRGRQTKECGQPHILPLFECHPSSSLYPFHRFAVNSFLYFSASYHHKNYINTWSGASKRADSWHAAFSAGVSLRLPQSQPMS